MNPNYDNLRHARDFLSRLLDLPPKEAMDMLANNGEDIVISFNEALGKEAFNVGDSVIALPEDQEEFVGTVVSIRSPHDTPVLFSVKDQDGEVFDCEAGELVSYQD